MQIFEMFGSILLKDDGIEGKLDKIDKKGNKVSKSIGTAFGAIGKAALVAGTAILAGLGAALVSGAKDAAEAEAKVTQLDAVLKSTGGAAGMTRDKLLGLAEGFEKTTKFSAEAALEAESLLLTFTNIGKDTFPRATKAAGDMATALGGDMAGQSIALGKALNDPVKGITALSRVGVSFTDEQKKSIKVMQEHGDMAGAQTIILKELEKEFGGSAEAAGKTFGGQLEILKNKFGAVTEALATKFIPYLQKFMDWTNTNMPAIQAVFSKAFDIVGKALTVVGGFITDTLIPAFLKLWDWISPRIPGIQKYIVDMVDMVVPKFQKIVDVVTKIWDEVFPNMDQTASDLSDTVKDLVEKGLDILISALSWVRDNHKFVVTAIEAIVASMVAYKLAVIAANVVQTIHNALITAMAVAHGVVKAAIVISTAVQWLFNAALSANPIGLVVIALAALGLAIYAVVKHWKDIVTWIQNAWNWLTKWNGTAAKNKNATVTTTYKSNFSASPNPTGGSGYNSGGGGFAVGTRYLPQDMIIQAHEGEMIVPKSENPYANSGGGTLPQGNSSGNINVNLIVDGKTLAQVVAPYTQQMARSRGRGMGVVAT